MTQLFSGLRFRLLILVVVACAPLVALTLHSAWEDRRRQERSWNQRTVRLAEVARKEEENLLGGATQFLLALAESSTVQSGNVPGTRQFLQDLRASYPRYWNLGLADTNGAIIVSAGGLPAAFGKEHRSFLETALRNNGLTVGKPSRDASGSSIPFGYPVVNRSGEIQGAVFALLKLPWMRYETATLGQLPKGATWTEVDEQGVILARYPNPDAWVGRTLPDRNLLSAAGRTPEGTLADKAEVRHFYAYRTRPSKLFGTAIVLLSTPKDSLFATADSALRRDLGWLGGALLLALGLGWVGSKILVVGPVRALVRSSARLAAGDLSARTGYKHHGGDELGQLTLAFDQMAQALEQREKDRLKAGHKLQVLSHRLVEVQESERRHIARELHDEIGQALTATEMNLQAALKAPQGAALQRRLQASIDSVEHVLEQVHDLSLNLRPSMLDDLGLEPALRWYLRRQGELADLHTEFRSDLTDERMPPFIETECFRVAQEALTNVMRHAKAHSISLELRKANGRLELTVRDDGVGFDVGRLRDEAVHGASLGLLSMDERATLAGGELEIISSPGEGTKVRAWFPLEIAALEDAAEVNENG